MINADNAAVPCGDNQEIKEVKTRSMVKETWRRFKKNRRAVISLIILMLMVVTAFGTIIIDFVTDGAFYTQHVLSQNLLYRLAPPSLAHPMGMDELGRDIMMRVIWGIRNSLFTGALATLGAMLAGAALGALSGYFKTADNIIMRLMDILMSIPTILLAIAIVAALGRSHLNVFLAILIANIPGFARIMRAGVFTVKDYDYIEAARSMCARDGRIIMKYIVPNALAPVIVHATMGVANAIMSIAVLSFLGLGIPPPSPEWGAMLSSARIYMRETWHMTVMPGAAIIVTVLTINIIGDALRDALDPRMRN